MFLLSLVLVLQILPGHFQIAFLTQVGIVLMVVWFVLEPWIWSEWVEDRTSEMRLRLQNAAGSYDLRMRSRGFSTHGASTLADGSPGSPGLDAARLRLSLWVRRHTLASG